MNKFILPVALMSLCSLASCKNSPKQASAATAENIESETKTSLPDPNDLLHTLEGHWQNEQDPAYTLEIADTQMRHFHAGAMTSQSMIEIDGACESPVCKLDGVDTSDGWCFTEITVNNGKYAAQCNFVTACDTARLQYRSLDSNGAGLSFKKIQ